jgi:TFIIF-interacting CTD phosphatase-like protein
VTRKLLILDLDETLVYGTTKPLARREDFLVSEYYIYKRPGLEEFLKFCLEHFDTAIWTSASRLYAEGIVKALFPEPDKLKFIWSRERCSYKYDHEMRESHWIKNLKKVKKLGYELGQIIMVDDTAEKMVRNYGNHILVSPYTGSEDDNELALLQKYIYTIIDIPNIRQLEKRGWKSKFL